MTHKEDYPDYPEGKAMGYNLCISCGMALTIEEIELNSGNSRCYACFEHEEFGEIDPYLPLDFD